MMEIFASILAVAIIGWSVWITWPRPLLRETLAIQTLRGQAFILAQKCKKFRAKLIAKDPQAPRALNNLDVCLRDISEQLDNLMMMHGTLSRVLLDDLSHKLCRRKNIPNDRNRNWEELVLRTICWQTCTLDHVVLGIIEEIGELTAARGNRLFLSGKKKTDFLLEIADTKWYTTAARLLIATGEATDSTETT